MPRTAPRPFLLRESRGFTLVELMTVVVILGILAVVAVGAYTRQVRNAHRVEVIGDLSNLTLRQKSFLAVSGHYASSTDNEDDTYPARADISDKNKVPYSWDVTAPGYTAAGRNGSYFRGGENLHGFDALRFLPQNGRSRCAYATISGHGTNAPEPNDDEPPFGQILGGAIFPTAAAEQQRLFASDWFYGVALCDFDLDGVYSAFTTAHYTTEISNEDIGPYRRGE